MTNPTPVTYADLLDAFEWVSASPSMETWAYISRERGSVHLEPTDEDELEEELPEDIEDGSLYIAVPHKNDLDLGRDLPLSFADERLPESYSTVAGFFHKRGAYRRFKDFLEQRDLLQDWYDYEAQAVEKALREWASRNDLQIMP